MANNLSVNFIMGGEGALFVVLVSLAVRVHVTGMSRMLKCFTHGKGMKAEFWNGQLVQKSHCNQQRGTFFLDNPVKWFHTVATHLPKAPRNTKAHLLD